MTHESKASAGALTTRVELPPDIIEAAGRCRDRDDVLRLLASVYARFNNPDAPREEVAAAIREAVAPPVNLSTPFPLHDFTDDIDHKFDEWRKTNIAVLQDPTLLSLLYDINRLPEVVATFRSRKMLADLVAIVEHFKVVVARSALNRSGEG